MRLDTGPFLGAAAVAAGAVTRRQLGGPRFVRLFRDVYVHASIAVDHRTRCEAAALLLPSGAAFAELSAAMLWGVPLNPPPQVSVMVPPGRRFNPREGLLVRRIRLAPGDATDVLGLRTTEPLRTAFDLAHRLPRVDAVIALDAMLRKRLIYLDKMISFLDARVGEFGVGAARRVIALTDPLSESPMETRLRLILLDGGLPPPVSQFRVMNGRRIVARLDFAYPDAMLVLEYDGDHHRDRITFRFDLERQNELRALGWTVLRFTADDVLRHPARVVAQVRSLLVRGGS
jgi:hypothetical protein